MEVFYELDYMMQLVNKHGRYLNQYFGFTLKEIAGKVGMNEKEFNMIVRGKRAMPQKHKAKFIEVFNAMQIDTKTTDFKPTSAQVFVRSVTEKIRLDKMRGSLYILFMLVTFREYICSDSSLAQKTANLFEAVFNHCANAAFFILGGGTTKSQSLQNQQGLAFLF